MRHDLRRLGELRLAQLPVDQRGAGLQRQLDDRGQRGEVGHQLLVGRRAVEPFGIFLGDEAGGEVAGAEPRVLQQRGEEIDIVGDALDLERVERRPPARRSPPRASAPS